MTPEEQHRLVQSVVAYGIVVESAEGYNDLMLTPEFAQCLLRLLEDAEYREVAINTWREWAAEPDYETKRGKLIRSLKEMEECRSHRERQSATHTDGTLRISKT